MGTMDVRITAQLFLAFTLLISATLLASWGFTPSALALAISAAAFTTTAFLQQKTP